MAIYHLTAKTGSKAKGQSAGAKFDYISREGKYTKDLDEVLEKGSGNMPAWALSDPSQYWQAADLHERANGRLFKELEFALPLELSRDQQVKLANDFAQSLAKSETLPYSLAVHAGKGENPHCHLIISERQNDGLDRSSDTWFKRWNGKRPDKGGARKTESLKPREWLENARQDWAILTNQALKRGGHQVEIDHRSLLDQGVDRKPTTHLGPNVVEMEAKGIRTRRGEKHLNVERENYERDRQDKIRKVKGRVSGSRGTNSPRISFDNIGDPASDGKAMGAFKGVWERFRPHRVPEGIGAKQRSQGAVYWALSRFSRDVISVRDSSISLSAIADVFRERIEQRRVAADEKAAARELERIADSKRSVERGRERSREMERLRAEMERTKAQSKDGGGKDVRIRQRVKRNRGRDDGGMSR